MEPVDMMEKENSRDMETKTMVERSGSITRTILNIRRITMVGSMDSRSRIKKMAFIALLSLAMLGPSGLAQAAFDEQEYFDNDETTCDFVYWTAVTGTGTLCTDAMGNGQFGTHNSAVADNGDGTHSPSAGTGPTSLHSGTHGTNGGFAYIEASGTGPYTATLTRSVPFDADTYELNISFAYSAYGANVGTLLLEANDGTGYVTEWSQVGDDGNAGAWTVVDLDLFNGGGASAKQYNSGSVDLRFSWTMNSFAGDAAIDTIRVYGPNRDTTPPAESGGSLAVSPDSGTYTAGTFTITEDFTDAESAVSACEYTINNGSNWFAGVVSGAGPYTCTASGVSASHGTALTIQMRATSTGGTSTPSATLSRTVDTAGPTDGTLNASPGDTIIDLSWSGFSDADSGLATSNTYKMVRATGATAPADCTAGTQVYLGTGTSVQDSGLTNGQQYSYRACAYDAAGNVSAGATASATPSSCPDGDVATLTITSPADTSTVSGIYIVQMQVGVETQPENMTGVQFKINGTWRDASWNAGSSRWQYSWDTEADYPGSATTPETGVTIDAHGVDPDCAGYKDAGQISVTVDNTTPGNALMHNSVNMGSTKWPQGWGITGGKYGKFTCETCHEKSTGNIKRLKETITAPSLENWSSSGTGSLTINVQNPNLDYGNYTAHSTSQLICEACHSRTNYHKYNQPTTTHNGRVDCTGGCHSHASGFKTNVSQACSDCHDAEQPGAGPYRRQVVGAGGDIGTDSGKASYHINASHASGDFKDSSCQSCHNHAKHQTYSDPEAGLLHPDTGEELFFANSTSIIPFCVGCHDSDGATRLGNITGLKPFYESGDNSTPLNIQWVIGGSEHEKGRACMNCHGNAGGTPGDTLNPVDTIHGSTKEKIMRLSGFTNDSAFKVGAEETCYSCHKAGGAMAAFDIYTMFSKVNSHSVSDCHICHNPHKVTATNRLRGVPGVEVTYSGPGSMPTFTEISTVMNEDEQYKVCFQCHSNYKNSAEGGSDLNIAQDFNPENDSFHWVVNDKGSPTAGNFMQFNLAMIGKMIPRIDGETDHAVIRQTKLRCSDCHGPSGADKGVNTPEGPHGSNHPSPRMLKVPAGSSYNTWNASMNYLTNPTDVWCFNCHDPNYTNSGWYGESKSLHVENFHADWACQTCHRPKVHGQQGVGSANQLKRLLNPATFMEGIDGVGLNRDYTQNDHQYGPDQASCT